MAFVALVSAAFAALVSVAFVVLVQKDAHDHAIWAVVVVSHPVVTCFWWQLTHNITILTIGLSLKESCLKINVKNVPTPAGCHLASHQKSWSCGRRRIGLLIFLLFVLENLGVPI